MSLIETSPNIAVSEDAACWPCMATEYIKHAVELVIKKNGLCNILMTGGNTAELLYQYWVKNINMPYDKMHLYFGDERCVPPEHAESNYALVMKTLFANHLHGDMFVVRMEGESKDRDKAARSYEDKLPDNIDIILLGMGNDGHIASLFPNSHALNSVRKVEAVTGTKPPFARLTITPRVIASAEFVFLLATGKCKGQVLDKALESNGDFSSMPVRLTINGIWLLDKEAANQLQTKNVTFIKDLSN